MARLFSLPYLLIGRNHVNNICILGCGALGSNFAGELVKRLHANDLVATITLLDFDTVESRNVVSQLFVPNQIGMLKVDAVAALIEPYELKINTINAFFDAQFDFGEHGIHADNLVLVDCFDDLDSRIAAWTYGMGYGIPVMHMGMSETGTGFVSWNYGDYDTFPYSPAALDPSKLDAIRKQITADKEEGKKIPPCELSANRPLIMNTVLAGLDSMSAFLGLMIKDVNDNDPNSFLSSWMVGPRNHSVIKPTIVSL